jgi:hypothetical protein
LRRPRWRSAGVQVLYIALFGGPAFFTDPRVLDASRGYAVGTAPWMQAISDTTSFAEAVARGTGAMAIKLYAALDSLTVTRATIEAHRQGLKVIAHATTFPGQPLDLIATGVDVLTHTPERRPAAVVRGSAGRHPQHARDSLGDPGRPRRALAEAGFR